MTTTEIGGGYAAKRAHLIYYVYVDRMVRGLGAGAKSLLDVGSNDAPYLEAFDWIDLRQTIDIRRPYSSPAVKGIKGDFLTFEPEQSYDLVTCFQVLEHISEPEPFAKRLLSIGKGVLVSVPFAWPRGFCRYHVQDPVDRPKLKRWFGRAPNLSVVVREPFEPRPQGSRRLIAYYHNDGQMPDMSKLRENLRQSLASLQ